MMLRDYCRKGRVMKTIIAGALIGAAWIVVRQRARDRAGIDLLKGFEAHLKELESRGDWNG
jgi:hypothetical protein